MIIIEGPDLVGKTTLAEKLQRKLQGFAVCHLSRPPVDFGARDYIQFMNPYTIWDRFHLSRNVYNSACGEPWELDQTQIEFIDAHLATMAETRVVITFKPDYDFSDRMRDGEMYAPGVIKEAANAFYSLAQNSGHWNYYPNSMSTTCPHYVWITEEGQEYPSDKFVDLIVEHQIQQQASRIATIERGFFNG